METSGLLFYQQGYHADAEKISGVGEAIGWLDKGSNQFHSCHMVEHITISAETAQKLERVKALTGRDAENVLNDALETELQVLAQQALKSAVAEGIADADAGRFSTKTVADIFAEGIARVAQKPVVTG